MAVAGALISGWSGFVPGLHLALIMSAAAFALAAVVTLASVRSQPHEPSATQPQPPDDRDAFQAHGEPLRIEFFSRVPYGQFRTNHS